MEIHLKFSTFFIMVAYFNCGNYVLAHDFDDDFYTAGVLEFENRFLNRHDAPEDYITSNVLLYSKFIDIAKEKNVDIIVFPEATFNYYSDKEILTDEAFLLPDPLEKIAPWKEGNYSEYLKTISRKCNESQIYALINVVEKVSCSVSNANESPKMTRKDKYNFYNTNIVFDRQGRIISRYRKYNLYNENSIDQPLIVNHATFMTDFGVKFGHFICFDILFQEPALNLIQKENVTNILFPSMWYSETPFLTSVQIHQGWAYANNVNLISSGASGPARGSSGSGIFIGHHLIAQSFITPTRVEKLITSIVPKDPRAFSTQQLQLIYQEQQELQKLEEQKRFTPVQMQDLLLTKNWAEENVKTTDILNQPQSICENDNNICCDFDIKMKIKDIPEGKIAYSYKLTVNYTTRIFDTNRQCGEVYCSVVACTNNETTPCGAPFHNNTELYDAIEFENITITAKIKYKNPNDLLVMPNTLDTSILPLNTNKYKFSFIKDELEKSGSFKEYKMQSQDKISNVLAFGIYGRNFALDKILPKKLKRLSHSQTF